mmetsp:Transcript_44074/g.79230  ORF Transcript_44074/g.79230 Transcript_44074/m.79230 type:complete len:106 (+) Transcript_44074:107-424(+)
MAAGTTACSSDAEGCLDAKAHQCKFRGKLWSLDSVFPTVVIYVDLPLGVAEPISSLVPASESLGNSSESLSTRQPQDPKIEAPFGSPFLRSPASGDCIGMPVVAS